MIKIFSITINRRRLFSYLLITNELTTEV